MPIASADIELRLSGGASNSNPLTSLGGAMSDVDATLSTLFAIADGPECTTGGVKYRMAYVTNISALTLEAAKAWLSANTPSPGTSFDIGLGTSGLNGTEQTVANDTTAPAGVTFSAPGTAAAALLLGDLPAAGRYPVWFRRTTTAGASEHLGDSVSIQLDGAYTE